MSSQPNWALIIPITAAVFGAVLGAFLKPALDQWYDRKRKTVKVLIDEPYLFKPPHPDLKLHWRNHSFDELSNISVDIRNSTGRTIRDLTIKFEAPAKVADTNFGYFVVRQGKNFRIGDYEPSSDSWDINIQHFERNGVIRAYLLSDYARGLTAYTMDDMELVIQTGGVVSKGALAQKLINTITVSVAAAGFAAAISTFFGS